MRALVFVYIYFWLLGDHTPHSFCCVYWCINPFIYIREHITRMLSVDLWICQQHAAQLNRTEQFETNEYARKPIFVPLLPSMMIIITWMAIISRNGYSHTRFSSLLSGCRISRSQTFESIGSDRHCDFRSHPQWLGHSSNSVGVFVKSPARWERTVAEMPQRWRPPPQRQRRKLCPMWSPPTTTTSCQCWHRQNAGRNSPIFRRLADCRWLVRNWISFWPVRAKSECKQIIIVYQFGTECNELQKCSSALCMLTFHNLCTQSAVQTSRELRRNSRLCLNRVLIQQFLEEIPYLFMRLHRCTFEYVAAQCKARRSFSIISQTVWFVVRNVCRRFRRRTTGGANNWTNVIQTKVS